MPSGHTDVRPSGLRQKAFKVRLCPTAEQAAQINRTIGSARFVYNTFLARRKGTYRETGKGLTRFQCDKELTALKREEGTAWLRDVDKFALQQALRDLDRAYENFFRDCRRPKGQRKSGFPQFRSKKGRKQSYRTN